MPQIQEPESVAGQAQADAVYSPGGNEASPTPGAYGAFTGRHLVYLCGFTLLAALLRLYRLGEWSFWVDEAHTFRDLLSPLDEFHEHGTSRYPLSFYLLRGLNWWFDMSPREMGEGYLRLPFAFFGIAAVPALAVVARDMVGRKAALLAALFLAVSPWHIFWSQNARFYSMVFFFSLLGIGAVYHGRVRSSLWLMVGGLVSLVIAGLCHPSAYAMSVAVLAYLVGDKLRRGNRRSRGRFGKWAPLAFLAVLVLLAPLMLKVLEQVAQVKKPEFSLFHLVQTLAYFVGIPILVAAGGGVLVLFDRGARPASFLTLMLVLPLLAFAGFASSEVLTSIGFPKVSAQYAFCVLPAVYILASVSIMHMVQSFGGVGLRPVVLRLVAMAVFVFHMLGQDYLYFQREYGWRPRWRESLDYVQQRALERGVQRVTLLTTNEPSMRYYAEARRLRAEQLDIELVALVGWNLRPTKKYPNRTPESYLAELRARVEAEGRELWAVIGEAVLDEHDLHGRAKAWLRRNLVQVRRLPNWTGPKDMVLMVYRSPERR